MKSTIAWSLAFFVVGLAFAGIVLVNPLHWSWAHGIQNGLGIPTAVMDSDRETDVSESQTGERQILYWRAPMDPNYIRDEPGLSPMGMELIPVYADEAGMVPGLVEIDPVFVQNMGVRTATVRRTDISHAIRTVGTFTYDESQIYSISTKYEGWLENVQVNYVGQPVERGQALFDVFSPQLVSSQQEYLDAGRYAARLDADAYPEIAARARSLVESSRQRLAYWDVSDDQIAMLTASGKPLRTMTIHSPVTGLVLNKMDQSLDGMLARPGMALYQLVDLSTIWLEAEIYETDVPWLRVGQRATIEIPHLSGSRLEGTVRYVYPYLDPSTRTLKLSIEVPNPSRELRADMYADVTFEAPAVENALVVPQEAVIRTGRRDVVIIDLGDGRFQVRPVSLGVNESGVWEIQEGVADGDRIVVSSQFLIDSESNLREAVRKLISGSEANELPTEGEASDRDRTDN